MVHAEDGVESQRIAATAPERKGVLTAISQPNQI
jgi:hypothetical protein